LLSIIEYAVTAIVCIITSVVIQRIYVKEFKKSKEITSVQGIKWFGLAIFVWGIGALVNLIFINFTEVSNKLVIYWGVAISLANSLFILLSLPSIEHSKSRGLGVRLVERFTTKEFIILFSGVLGMIAFVFLATSFTNNELSINFTWLIDIPISIFVAVSLLFELNKAFSSRQMKFMYLPTVTLFVLIIIAVCHRIIPQDQLIELINQEFWALVGSITSISFKFLFILLFSILLYSWKFLSEKEEQQNLANNLSLENRKIKKELEQFSIANESHLDTIKHLKKEIRVLENTNKVELSGRQKEVLGNLAYGGLKKSYSELANEMNISVDGLQTHIHQIKKILNISGSGGKEQLIDFAIKNGFLDFSTLKQNN